MTDGSIPPRPKRSDPGYQKWWKLANPEKAKAIRDRSRARRVEKSKEEMRIWRAKNKEHERAYSKKYEASRRGTRAAHHRADYHKHRESRLAKAREAHKKNPLPRKIRKAKRRAKELSAPGFHTEKDLRAIFARQNGLCANPYCKMDLISVAANADHIMAVANGGTNWPDNLQWLCQPCNQRKTNFHVLDWLDRERKRATYLRIFLIMIAIALASPEPQ